MPKTISVSSYTRLWACEKQIWFSDALHFVWALGLSVCSMLVKFTREFNFQSTCECMWLWAVMSCSVCRLTTHPVCWATRLGTCSLQKLSHWDLRKPIWKTARVHKAFLKTKMHSWVNHLHHPHLCTKTHCSLPASTKQCHDLLWRTEKA